MTGADGWQVSNVNVLSSAAHLASLEIFKNAGISKLRQKSVNLTSYLEFLINNLHSDLINIITPSHVTQRGCQLSIIIKERGKEVFEALTREVVIADWREPEVIRIAPVPLYNTYLEVFKFYAILKNTLGL